MNGDVVQMHSTFSSFPSRTPYRGHENGVHNSMLWKHGGRLLNTQPRWMQDWPMPQEGGPQATCEEGSWLCERKNSRASHLEESLEDKDLLNIKYLLNKRTRIY